MNRIEKKREEGFILLMAILWLVTMSIVASGIMFSAKQFNLTENNFVDMDDCFMFAQSALGKVRLDLINDFESYFKSHNSNTGALKDWYYDELSKMTEIADRAVLSGNDGSGKSYPVNWAKGNYTCTIVNKYLSGGVVDILLRLRARLGAARRTFEEHVRIDLESGIFKYAYFINNKGWMFGSDITLNGDVRANGNFAFDYTPTVNGETYAAWNYERVDGSGQYVKGEITNRNETGNGNYRSDGRSDYERKWLESYSAKTGKIKARDMADLNEPNPGTDYVPEDRESGKMPANEKQDPLPMPYLGDLSAYEDLCRSEAANGWSRLEYTDENGNKKVITNGVYSGAGPDGETGTIDDKTLVITGDIKIMGPVVIPGDLIIKGTYSKFSSPPAGLQASQDDINNYTTMAEQNSLNKNKLSSLAVERKFAAINGKGGMFVGRNVHIVGDLKSSSKTNNDTDPFLSLAAKGNVIAGPPQEIDEYYISDFCQPYATDDPDYHNTDITYTDYQGNTVTSPAFDGNYTAFDSDLAEGEGGIVMDGVVARDWYSDSVLIYYSTDGSAVNPLDELYTSGGNNAGAQIKVDGQVYNVSSVSTSATSHYIRVPDPDRPWRYVTGYKIKLDRSAPVLSEGTGPQRARRYYQPSINTELMNSLAYKPSQIDSVLFTNHAIGGTLGYNSALNGAVIGRDEAFLFDGSISMNWDQRLARSGSGSGIGQMISYLLPRTFDPTYNPDRKIVRFWREVFVEDDY